jgi:anti-anti-sigma factor
MAKTPRRFPDDEVPCLPCASIAGTGPGAVTLTVSGDVDTFGTPVLEAALEVVWCDDPRRVVVDLTGVTFLGLSALHALLRTRTDAEQRGADLTFRTASRHIARVLGLVGAGDVTQRCGCGADAESGAPIPGARVDPPEADEALRPHRGVLTLVPEPTTDADPSRRPSPDIAGPDDALLRTLCRGAEWGSSDDLQATLKSVSEAAATTIPGAEGACIRLMAPGHHDPEVRAGTDRRAAALDVVQDGLCRPPGREKRPEASWSDGVVLVDDLASDPRWPELAARAQELHVRSVLCLSLGTTKPRGALTVWSSRPAAFTQEARRLGQILAAVAAIALPAAQRQQNLARALTTRDVIGQAKGVLMERHKITAEQAFLLLNRASCARNIKLRILAQRVADTGEL